MSFVGHTVLISGSTRGIGRAVAIAYGKLGANVIVTGRTTKEQSNSAYTIYETADEVVKVGGNAIALEMDIRDDEAVKNAVENGINYFKNKGLGSQLDILVNNAGHISLTNVETTPMDRYDQMNQIHLRGSYLLSKVCLPYLKESPNPHIVSFCPPLDLNLGWFKDFSAYTVCKFGMSMYVLGMAAEFKQYGIAVNGLWPRVVIATESVKMAFPNTHEIMIKKCHKPEIMADATVRITEKPAKTFTGNLLLDEDFLRAEGVSDFKNYLVDPGAQELLDDLFIPGTRHILK